MKVEKILKKNDKVEIYFENKKKIIVSLDTFFEHPVSKGTILEEDKIKKIKNFEKKLSIKKKIIDFAQTKKRSEYEINLFLDNLNLEKKEKVYFKKNLEKYGLIDDRELAKIIVLNQLDKKNGFYKIKKRLQDRNIFVFSINDLIDKKKYLKNLEELKEKFLFKYENDSFYKKKEKIYKALLNRGYLHEESFISNNFYDEKKEIINALNEYEKTKNKTNQKKEIVKKMLQKGFRYNIVDKIVKGEIKND